MTQVDLAAARAGIDAFWSAWPRVREELDRAVASESTDGIVELVSPLVDAIHPQLAWEHAKGLAAANAIVVTSEGNRALRSTSERWLRSAPAPDEAWEFHPARQPDPTALGYKLSLDGVELDLEETRVAFEVDEERRRVHVTVHHPSLRRLGDSSRTTFTYLVLDWLLGEDGVERWVGGVETAAGRWFRNGQPPRALLAVVEELARAGGDDDWLLLETATEDGRPVIAVALARLSPVDQPLLDLHVAVELPFESQNEWGFPLEPSSAALNAFEDDLGRRLGSDGMVVAREAFGGIRTIHAYADAESDAFEAARELAGTWAEGEARARSVFDPEWSSVAHLRT